LDQITERYTAKLAILGSNVSVIRCLDRKYCSEPEALLEKEARCIDCEYVKNGSYGYVLAPPSYQTETETVNGTRSTKIIEINTTIETEKIYTNTRNGFIIGYADIVVQVRVKLETELITSQRTWCFDEEKVFYIIIDAKPKLSSWGGPLRQVKTYMKLQQTEHNDPVYGLITTYSTINELHLEVIEEEQVSILTLPLNFERNRNTEDQLIG